MGGLHSARLWMWSMSAIWSVYTIISWRRVPQNRKWHLPNFMRFCAVICFAIARDEQLARKHARTHEPHTCRNATIVSSKWKRLPDGTLVPSAQVATTPANVTLVDSSGVMQMRDSCGVPRHDMTRLCVHAFVVGEFRGWFCPKIVALSEVKNNSPLVDVA